jgi:RNA polymerase sigma factor (sigma-70 family)
VIMICWTAVAAAVTAAAAAVVGTVTAARRPEPRRIPSPVRTLPAGGGALSLPAMTAVTPESPDILQALVDNHRRFLAFLEKRVGSREEAEDILQDGFARALKRAGEIRHSESAIPWFYRLLRNAVTDHYRRRGAEDRAMELIGSGVATSIEMEDEELRDLVCGCVLGLVETLKPEYAEALREVDLRETSLADYAGKARITPNNAAVRLHRARQALRKQVIRSCGTCTIHGCEECACRRC